MEELRSLIMVDNQEAVRLGDLEKNMGSRKVVKHKFTTDIPEAVLREGADELTLRQDDTKDVGDSGWGPPLVDEDWHAICQAIFKGVTNLEKTRRPKRLFSCKRVHKIQTKPQVRLDLWAIHLKSPTAALQTH